MPRKPQGTRSALLSAALDAFAEKGYAGASIRGITQTVGVRESAFYAHFASKRAIYDELFARAGPPVVARAIDTLPEDAAPGEFLPRFAESIVDEWSTADARKFAAMMMRDAFDDEAHGWRTLRASIDGVLSLLVLRFERWQRSKRIRSDLTCEMLAFEFVAAIAVTRFIYFNIAAGRRETARGRALVLRHVETFLGLIEPRAAEARSR